GPGALGPRYDRWGVDIAPVCRAPDPAGSCPNCFSHDDPNDPARAPGKGPKAWWDNSSCRTPDFPLPQLSNRTSLLAQLERLQRGLEETRKTETWDVHRQQAMHLVLTSRPGG